MASLPVTPDPALERHRQRLEESLEKLRKALRHWQIFSAEYEAFREELEGLPADASREDMLAVGIGFGGTVVDEKEITALLGDKLGIKRTVSQVIATVSHRIDYVQENVTKVEKQLEQGETKLASLLVVAGPDFTDEEGLPIMDIREELDEEDNVINATINGNNPSSPTKPMDTEGLEKIVDIAEKPETKTPGNLPKKPSPLREVTNQDPTPSTNAEIYACEPTETPAEKEVKVISSKEEEGGGIVKILDDPKVKEDWVKEVPGESEEDAEMRRQMLKYNMQEIGAVVAEINLDEEGDYYGYEDSDDYDDEDEDDDEEDEYGRTKLKVITPELQREMEELQRRVKERAEAARNRETAEKGKDNQQSSKKGVRFAKELDISPAPAPTPTFTPTPENLPPMPTPPSASNQEDAIPLLLDLMAMDEMRKAELRKAELVKAGMDPPVKSRVGGPSVFKSERATTSKANTGAPELSEERVVPSSALAPTVMERPPGTSGSSTPVAPPSATPRKPSRFKAAKAAATLDTIPTSIYKNTNPSAVEPDDDESRKPTMSNFIKEREPSKDPTVEPPDELDPSIHRREVATEFHRMRTKMIQQQGGFVATEEDEAIVPLNQDGEKKKVSRFKAARLQAMDKR